ncbi:MAG: TonB-dependent receptor [Parapedobacter sp.]|nr:MAG: TonB-dependent receptor [Parapedobacter sp.]
MYAFGIAQRCSVVKTGIVLLIATVALAGAVAGRPVGQQREIGGTVTDESGTSLPGVTVSVKGTTSATTTGESGNYRIYVPDQGVAVLVFSLMGFVNQEVEIKAQSIINVSLQAAVSNLDEVVVIGYGTVKRSDLTGSVSTIKSEDFNPGQSGGVQGLIQGKLPGVRVVESSGEPGGGYSISIRGSGSISAGTGPLWVVDGSPMAGGLRTFNPEDIESIEVLKDASATAIYGSRAAGGVIMVTTKKGGSVPLQVNYSGYLSFNQPINNITLLTPEQYQTVSNAIIDDGGGNPEDRIESTGAGTDWMAEIFNPGAVEHNHSLAFSGRLSDLNYYVSLNATDEAGVIRHSNFQRYGGRINLNYAGDNKFRFGTNLRFAHIEDQTINKAGVNENAGAVYSALFFDPTLPVRDETGAFTASDLLTINNPLAILEGEDRGRRINQFAGNIYSEYAFLPSLSVRLNVGFDIGDNRNDNYISRQTIVGAARGGVANIDQSQNFDSVVDATIRYAESFNEHELNLLAGVEVQKFRSSGLSMHAEGFPADGTGTDNMALGNPETFTLGSSRTSNSLASAFGRVNYTFKDRYLLTATMRADGSTRFGTNNKFGYFPSFAFAWHLGKEPFVEQLAFVNELKPRISWGRTGNQSIGDFLSITTFARGATAIWNDAQQIGLTPARLPNEDIRWETSQQLDVGLDFAFFNSRLVGHFDYFQQKTFDMLMAVPLPVETGFQTQIQNIGSIANHGVEFDITTRNIVRQDFSWTTNLNMATVHNKVTDIGNTVQVISGSSGFTNNFLVTRVGQPLRSYFGYKVEGVWQTNDDFSQTTQNVKPGDLKYVDQDANGEINADDRVILGNAFPDLTLSFGNRLSYKNFGLVIFIEGVQGVSMLNNNLVDTYFPLQNRRNKYAEPYLNRWTPENPSNKYPSFVSPGSQGQNVVNSLTVEDASYIRLKSVQLSYDFPSRLLGNALRGAQLYVTATNLKTWSDYSGFDPALNSGGDPNAMIDYNAYPLAQKFQIGAKVDF